MAYALEAKSVLKDSLRQLLQVTRSHAVLGKIKMLCTNIYVSLAEGDKSFA